MFENSKFIKSKSKFVREDTGINQAPLFYKEFEVETLPKKAELYICGLGISYAYINGKRVSEDLFTPPVTRYEKARIYMKYDILQFLKKGKNYITVICGNGFLNEEFENVWDSDKNPLRDNPKLNLSLYFDNEFFLGTDESFLCSDRSPYVLNSYRLGVKYDARRKMPDEITDYSGWDYAVADDEEFTGEYRLFECEPVREKEYLRAVSVIEKPNGKLLYDFGINISGYVKITLKKKEGEEVTLRYAESIDDKNNIDYNEMLTHYGNVEFQVEHIICRSEEFTFNTLFSYYGFRYVEIEGAKKEEIKDIKSVFVHQDIERKTDFKCSDKFLNWLYEAGIRSSYSNLYYMPTDCPTREKYGWMNDVHNTAEQYITDFRVEKTFVKWTDDMCDAFCDSKGLPGIVPTHGWGYDWGNGPVSDGCFFEIPYRIYLHNGDAGLLKKAFPYYKRYFKFIKTKENKDGYISDFGLWDWAPPTDPENYEIIVTPLAFINSCLLIKFLRIAMLACDLQGFGKREFEEEEKRQISLLSKYINKDGTCTVDEQTAVAMLIYFDLFDREVLKKQLIKLIEERDFHNNCGTVGIRYLYMALNKLGLQNYAYKMITVSGYPSYRLWYDKGATNFWETWQCVHSKNHQMFTDVLSWMLKTICGIIPDENKKSFDKIEIKPYFFKELDNAEGFYDSPKGRVKTVWMRKNGKIHLKITAPCDNYVMYNNKSMKKGINEFTEESL